MDYSTRKKNLIPNSISLEERIFNVTCLISFFTCVFEFVFNLILGTQFGVYLCIFGMFFCASIYYISFYKKKTIFSIKALCLASNIAFGINYFYSAGISGPSFLFFAAVFLMTVAIIPKKSIKKWISLNIFMFLLVVSIEYFYPQTVVQLYGNLPYKLLNFTVTYLVLVAIIYFSFTSIRKNYEIERFSVIEKNKAIEKQKIELEKLNIEKNKLFSIVSHDLRHPLNSIQGYLELLIDEELTTEDRTDLKNQLLSITKNTSEMLSNILFWAKSQMEEGSYAVMEPLSLKDVLLNSLNVEQNIALKKGVNLSIEVNEDCIILADRNMFQIVIRNLVSNAIKFTPTEGRVEVSAQKKEGNCCITVKDNGLGIDLAQQETLFKLKASSTYGTNNEKGIGLGLLLCKEFVDLQGGEISFESSKNSGAVFFVSFKLES